MRTHMYNSDTDAWSEAVHGPPVPTALVGTSIFLLIDARRRLLRYDLTTGDMRKIPLPEELDSCACALTTTGGGRLDLARIYNSRMFLWSMDTGAAEEADSKWRKVDCWCLHSIHFVSGSNIFEWLMNLGFCSLDL